MKALQNIQNEAKQIVEQLADRQINNMKERYNEFLKWINVEGGAIMANYGDGVDMYQTAHKYIFMTQYKKWNRDLGKYELPVAYPSDYRGRNEMSYNKDLMFQVMELRLQITGNWEARYREDFISQNMAKLNRALAKDITNDMLAQDIKVSIGGDGAEVTAIINQTKRFKPSMRN